MPSNGGASTRVRLSIDVEPELRRRIKALAAERDLSVREFVEDLLRRALEAEEQVRESGEAHGWARLSARSFARDWESEEDRGYDRFPQG